MAMTAWQIAQLLIMYGPDAVKAIVAIFKKPTISDADWDELFSKVSQKSWEDYLAAAQAQARNASGLPGNPFSGGGQ